MKKCHQCEESKQVKEFPKVGRKCKICKASNLRKYRKNNRQHVLANSKVWRNNNKEKINTQKKKSYKRNAPTIKKKNNDYYHKNAEVRKLWQRTYQVEVETKNVQSWLEKCMKGAKAGDKKYKREFDLNIRLLLDLYKQQSGKCALSGLQMTHQRDDLFAISVDRIDSSIGHTKDNVQLVCSALNRAKREYSNQKTLDFVEAIKVQAYLFKDFGGFNYPESTKPYTPHKKLRFKEEKLRPLFNESFEPPTYNKTELMNDCLRVADYGLIDYFKEQKWRSHKPENKPWAGKKLVWHFHPHLWKVKTQKKPIMSEVWGSENKIFERTLTNLADGQTKISLDRIIREFIFSGVGVPSQIHAGFAKAVYEHFGCLEGDVVYDPFAGWGGRLLAAADLGLKYKACELSFPTWEGLVTMAEFIKYENACIFNVDSLTFEPPNCKVMFTSPPFGSEEYVGSDHSVDLDQLLAITNSISTRILHVNKDLLDKLQPTRIIEVGAKSTVGPNKINEFLAIYE